MEIVLNRIRDLRQDMDLTQAQLANILNIHTTTYARWEQNNMQMKFPDIIKIAKFYDVSIDYIAGLTNDKRKFW